MKPERPRKEWNTKPGAGRSQSKDNFAFRSVTTTQKGKGSLLQWEKQTGYEKNLEFRQGLDVSTLAAHPRAAWALVRFLKNRSRGRQATRTLSTAFPNSRSCTSPRSAMGIRADARAYTPARDGGLREKACSTAFPRQPAKAKPSRLCEISRRAPHYRPALQRASPHSERRFRPILHEPASACSARG